MFLLPESTLNVMQIGYKISFPASNKSVTTTIYIKLMFTTLRKLNLNMLMGIKGDRTTKLTKTPVTK